MNESSWKLPLAVFTLLIGMHSAPLGAQEADVESPAEPPATEAAPASGDQEPVSEPPAEAEGAKTKTLLVNEKHLQFTVPASWKVVKPRNNIIEMELAILPRARQEDATVESNGDGSDQPRGRLTMMAAGGDVDGNIRRWVGQFRLGRDADGKDAMRRDHRKLRGAAAHVLDIAGTYFDSPQGPRGPKVELPDYRMLGAIIEVEGAGKYFVKFYGPASIVEANQEGFEQMLSSLQVVDPPLEAASPEPDPPTTPDPATKDS